MPQAQPVSINPLAILPPPRKKERVFTLQEYLKREENSVERHEYHDGKIIKLPMAKGPHNIIAANLIASFHGFVRANNADLTVFAGNQKVFVPSLNLGLYPDALVLSREPLYWDDNQVLLINPLLIVEVLSKSTRQYDLSDKFNEYQHLPSFEEYVLVEQDKMQVQTRFREEQGLWRYTTYADPDSRIVLKSIGCTLTMQEIYHKVSF